MNTDLNDILDAMADGASTRPEYVEAISKALEQGFGMIEVGELAVGDEIAYVMTDPLIGNPYGAMEFALVTRIEPAPYDMVRVHHSGEYTDACDFENVLARKN